jgi:hypothetical protein
VETYAQNYDNPGLGERPVSAHPQDFKPLGVRAGSFMLHPGVQLAAYITAQSNWSRHSFNVRLAADIARYKDYGFRDYEDYFFLVNGRLDVKNRSHLTYSADYMNLHEGLSNRDAEQGIVPTRYDLWGGSLGYDHTFNRLSIGVGYSLRTLDYDNARTVDDEIIDNSDRNRDESSAYLRMGYQFRTDKQAFVSISTRDVEYDQPFDRNGYRRDNDGWNASAGLALSITSLLAGDVFVSYHDTSYDDPGLEGIDGWAAGMSLQWTPTRLTSVGASITSNIQETTYEYASGYLMTLYSLRVDHELTRDLQLSGMVSYRDNDYTLTKDAPENPREQDSVWQMGLGMTYFINRHMFASASYTWEQLDSDNPADEYDANRLWVTLSFER